MNRAKIGLLCWSLMGITAAALGDEPDFSFGSRDYLLHDWGGIRKSLDDRGLFYELIYTAEFFENVSGGQKTGGDYRGDISLFLDLDTEKAGWWDGGNFFVQFQEEHGRGITERYVGDFQVLSNIDADDFRQISEFWYRQNFLNDRLWIKIGKQEANADFAFVDYGAEFIHSSPGFSPTIPLVTFPDQDWGVVIGVEPVEWFSMNTGVYQGRPDGGRSIGNTLDHLYGPLVLVEPAFHYFVAGHPGHFRVGGWWNGDRFDRFDRDNPDPGTVGESYGGYVTWEQEIWKENSDQEEDEQGIGLFGQYGFTPEDRSEANHYLGGGMQWTGVIPGRDEDVLGVGVFHVRFSDEAGFVQESETAFETFYLWAATGWMRIKPDMQYILNPGGLGASDALALGLRCEMAF